MNLYLVRGEVERSKYMDDKKEWFKDIRLVKANSEEDARNKWTDYWNCDRGTMYVDTYYARGWEATVSGVLE